MRKYFVILFQIFGLFFLSAPSNAFAAATVTVATGGSSISADTAGGSYTSLTGPIISEGVTADIGVGTIILNAPSGFAFDTGGTAPTVRIDRLTGNGASSRNINGATSGTSVAITSITTSQITFTVTSATTNSVTNSLTWQNVRLRPTAGTPLASGNITSNGTATVQGVTAGSTNLGTLTEVAGVKSKVAITTDPSSTATAGTDFGTKPVVEIQDVAGNTVTSDTTSAITISVVLSTQSCGGTAGSGTLSSTPSSGATVSSGVLTYSAMQYSAAESIKLCFSSSGITSALSSAVTVSSSDNPAPTLSSISPSSATVGGAQFTLTASGSNFISSSVVNWNGSALATTYVNSTTLTATVPAANIASAGSASVTVVTPSPGGGTSSSQTFSITTSSDTTAPAAISNLALSGATNSSVEVTWTASGDDNNSGTAASYDLRYSTSLITSGNFSSAIAVSGEPTPSAAGSSESMTVSGLSSGTTYYFALRVSDEAANVSAISNIPSVTTTSGSDTTPPVAVSDLAAFGATENSVTVSWTAPGDNGNTGTASSYDLRYSTSPITSENFTSATVASGVPAPSVAGTYESMVISSLSSGTTYYFAIKATDAASNNADISNVPSAATTAAEVSNITISAGAAVAPRSITITGQGYPQSTVQVLRKSSIDLSYSQVPLKEFVVNADGSFSYRTVGLLGGDYLLELMVKDKKGVDSGVVSFVAVLSSGDALVADGILVQPTISAKSAILARGSSLDLSGFSAPESIVTVEIDNKSVATTSAAKDGSWSFSTSTVSLSLGNHFVRARQLFREQVSNYSLVKTIKISQLTNPRADINGDNAVDIKDWSIFLSRWGSTDKTLRLKNDINGDGVVNIVDFSSFLRAIQLK